MGFIAQAPCSDGCFPTPSGWLMYLTETGITSPYLNTDLVQQAVAFIRNLGMFGDLSVPQLSLASNVASPDTTTYAATYRIALRAPVKVARVVVRTGVEVGSGPDQQTPRPVFWGGIKLRAIGDVSGRGSLAAFAWAYPTATGFYTAANGRVFAELAFATPVGSFVGPAAAFEISGNFAACCPDTNYVGNTISVYQIRMNPPADQDCGC